MIHNVRQIFFNTICFIYKQIDFVSLQEKKKPRESGFFFMYGIGEALKAKKIFQLCML
ncbi:protein of unknown function [Petrocella atlantisensis]|uniref:Uncharacterized protein n=1 Tax=Petrocella atlantisensis TaxID=2173034 RepID=A0A3P7S0Q7_9FIRM|nr:protein of unknown function [Petrocella atlantisensis]